jgi:hypothetical protein
MPSMVHARRAYKVVARLAHQPAPSSPQHHITQQARLSHLICTAALLCTCPGARHARPLSPNRLQVRMQRHYPSSANKSTPGQERRQDSLVSRLALNDVRKHKVKKLPVAKGERSTPRSGVSQVTTSRLDEEARAWPLSIPSPESKAEPPGCTACVTKLETPETKSFRLEIGHHRSQTDVSMPPRRESKPGRGRSRVAIVVLHTGQLRP